VSEPSKEIPTWESEKLYRIKIRGNIMIVESTDPKTGKVEIKKYLKP
jgi:hypothetical protein